MENTEFEQMREQINLLKTKLDKQSIVNDRLLRETINSKVGFLKRQEWFTYSSAIFAVVFGSFVFKMLNMSWWFVGATIIYLIIAVVATYLMHKNVNRQDVMNENLLSAAKDFRKMKQGYLNWFKYAFPTIIPWFAWFVYEIYKSTDEISSVISLSVSGLVGGIIGGLIGYSNYRKVLRSCDEIVDSIEKQ